MKEWLAIALGLAALAGLMLFTILYRPDVPVEDSIKSTTLPIVSNRWKEIDLEEGSNTSTSVLELKHGWLVYRQNGFGGGMAFVPKTEPAK